MIDTSSAIQAELEETKGDIKRAARNIGFNYQAALLRFSENQKTSIYSFGRPQLRKYIIAYRNVNQHWPRAFDDALDDARKKYDAGTHEMCQGRDGNIIIQYLIPRLVPCRPRKFFSYDTFFH